MTKHILIILLLSIAVPLQAEQVSGKVVSITDGDTLVLLVNKRQIKIRLAEIDTPEKAQPWGNKAKKALSKKVFRENVTVDITDIDRYGRAIGKIWLSDRDINRELVAEGHAWVYRQYMRDASLLEDEKVARAQELGLWSLDNPVPPWQWRRGARVSQGVREEIEEDSSCGSKRYCREMASCGEAKFYLNECGLSKLDGDGDGVPCESICRR